MKRLRNRRVENAGENIDALRQRCIEAFEALRDNPTNEEKKNALKVSLYFYGNRQAKSWPRMDTEQPCFDRILTGAAGDFQEGIIKGLVQAAKHGDEHGKPVEDAGRFINRAFGLAKKMYLRAINSEGRSNNVSLEVMLESGEAAPRQVADPREGRWKEDGVAAAEFTRLLKRHIKGDEAFGALRLSVLEMQDYPKIAAMLGLSASGTRVKVSRERNMLKNRFSAEYESLPGHAERHERKKESPGESDKTR